MELGCRFKNYWVQVAVTMRGELSGLLCERASFQLAYLLR